MSAKANFQASDFAVVDLMTSFGQLHIGYLSWRGKKGRQLTALTNANTKPFVARRVRGRRSRIKPCDQERKALDRRLFIAEGFKKGIGEGRGVNKGLLRKVCDGLLDLNGVQIFVLYSADASREINRNGGQASYRASQADQSAWDRAHRPKTCKLVANPTLAHVVAGKLQRLWSPEQIAGWLKHRYSGDENFQVSHETIYRSLFIQARGALKKELLQYLRRTRVMRRSRHHTQKTDDHGRITDTVSIRERPATVEDRAVPGHWEGDLLFGNQHSQIATLVERQSRYVMLVKVANKDTETVINALIKHAHKLPRELYQSLTWDRGKEMANHKRFTLATDIKVYFCDPQSPWQRGSNENTNGLLRQYLPKGIDLSAYSQAKLNAVARQLNTRPRKTLNYETPAERFNQFVASIG